MLGTLTTLAWTSSAANRSRASSARCTSEPVAIKMMLGRVPDGESRERNHQAALPWEYRGSGPGRERAVPDESRPERPDLPLAQWRSARRQLSHWHSRAGGQPFRGWIADPPLIGRQREIWIRYDQPRCCRASANQITHCSRRTAFQPIPANPRDKRLVILEQKCTDAASAAGRYCLGRVRNDRDARSTEPALHREQLTGVASWSFSDARTREAE